ncbi:hypothetical protein EVAR_18217_1 [Eumeta japonica]|uniref:Uncharacterized protein n=1 Tax=Eumeta variegata TaxID=151549 RepID=A0A4C1UKA0_EUMVA|nr:hypothetical protein EVAR_18217_1 [Eumeta japonica]
MEQSAVPHPHRIQVCTTNFRCCVSELVRFPVVCLPSISAQPPSTNPIPFPSTPSLVHQPTPSSIRYPISAQETSNALVSPPESRMFMGSGDHLHSGG